MEPEIPNTAPLIGRPFNRTNGIPVLASNGIIIQDLTNPFLGYPCAPMIGRYGGAGYNLNSTLLHAELLVHSDKGSWFADQQPLNIPKQVLKVLTEVPELIPHNKPPKRKDTIGSKPVEKDEADQTDNQIQFHPFSFSPRDHFKFRFLISTEENTNKKPNGTTSQTNLLNSQQYASTDLEFLNYVNHCYIFTAFNFEQRKRLVQYLPCCLVEPSLGQSGVQPWTRDYKSLSFDQLRSEYISFHLKKGAPAFSPNNLKIGVKAGHKVLHFFTVILLPTEYSVNYHWHFMDKKLANDLKHSIAQASNMAELLFNCEAEFGSDSPYLRTLRQIFYL